MPFSSGIAYLDGLAAWDGRTKFTLDTQRELMRLLGNPERRLKVIHVAGTNGKGTVCAQLAAFLYAAGSSVGHYLSPHLTTLNERCLLNGAPVSEEQLFAAVKEVADAARHLSVKPSFFEAVTAAAFLVFSRMRPEWLILEVGLGGRLDATNVIESPEAAVITSIGKDHTQILGATIPEIAREKAGIIKPGRPVFVGAVPFEAEREIRRAAEKAKAPTEVFGREFSLIGADLESVAGRFRFNESFLRKALHEQRNLALAVRVGRALGLDDAALRKGLAICRWPGRLERRSDPATGAEILFDVAHNLDGINALADYLLDQGKVKLPAKVSFVISILEHKDWHPMLARLQSVAAEAGRRGIETKFFFTRSDHPSSADPGELLAQFKNGESLADSEAAFQKALAFAGREGLTVVTGSLFLVSKLRALVVKEPFRTIVE